MGMIKGGVSPFPARKRSGGAHGRAKAGKHGISATSRSSSRGGYSRSGGAGVNVEGYNVRTRLKPSEKLTFPRSGGSLTRQVTTKDKNTSSQPYTFDKDGRIVISPVFNNVYNSPDMRQDQEITTENNPNGHYETRTRTIKGEKGNLGLPSYEDSWKDMEDVEGGKKKNKYGKIFDTFEDYVTDAKEWWASPAGQKRLRELRGGSGSSGTPDRTETYQVWVPDEGSSSTTIKQSQSIGG